MVKAATLALSLLATIGVSRVGAVDILFRRFATESCDEASNIHADTHLDDTHCKSFSDHEPVYLSFKIEPEDDMEDLQVKNCKATVYADEDCKGQAARMGDMRRYMGKCVNPKLAGRSVLISCQDRSQTNTVTVTNHVTDHDRDNYLGQVTTLVVHPVPTTRYHEDYLTDSPTMVHTHRTIATPNNVDWTQYAPTVVPGLVPLINGEPMPEIHDDDLEDFFGKLWPWHTESYYSEGVETHTATAE